MTLHFNMDTVLLYAKQMLGSQLLTEALLSFQISAC